MKVKFMAEKKNKSKGKGFNKLIYIAGTAALVFMLGFSTVNFIRDARVLKLPILSKAAASDKAAEGGEVEDYKTLKYKKPAPVSTTKPKKSPAPKKSAAPTPKPTPKVIPSSQP